MNKDLTGVDSHFEFGRNWQGYVEIVTEEEITRAVESLRRLFPNGSLQGKNFLDIGCGSGMTMLAAKRLGAVKCTGYDIDENSVKAAKTLLARYEPDLAWEVGLKSVFGFNSDDQAEFEVVHSWGVLHHTGDMWRAIEAAAKLVAPGGVFALAIYRKSPFCSIWRVEKKLYTQAGETVKKFYRGLYKALYLAGILATGRSPFRYLENYKQERGMDWGHDVHDWLGGFPYESATAEEIGERLNSLGFTLVREFTHKPRLGGLFGTHCDEFVFRRA